MEQFDALTEGVALGGLRTKSEIRVLLCYLLSSIGDPLSEDDLMLAIETDQIANYFETKDALAKLVQAGHICKLNDDSYKITDSGREIAETLDITLPLSIRDRVLATTIRLMAKARNKREHSVTIEATDTGYIVTCHISGGTHDMMSFSLAVPDKKQATLVKERFYEDPGKIYTLMLCALTEES